MIKSGYITAVLAQHAVHKISTPPQDAAQLVDFIAVLPPAIQSWLTSMVDS
jgi:hypothetical protein